MNQKTQYPLMPFHVDLKYRGRDRHYTLTLGYDSLHDLLCVDSGSGLTSQYAKDGVTFRLFHGMKTDAVFRPMPEGVEYYAYFGGGPRSVADLVKLLKHQSPMPIHLQSVVPGDRVPINVGYVHFKTVFGKKPESVDETLK